MLFWAFLVTTGVYTSVGVACAVTMRLVKKGVSVGIPLFFLIYAELRVVCGDAVACEYTFVNACVNTRQYLFSGSCSKVNFYEDVCCTFMYNVCQNTSHKQHV